MMCLYNGFHKDACYRDPRLRCFFYERALKNNARRDEQCNEWEISIIISISIITIIIIIMIMSSNIIITCVINITIINDVIINSVIHVPFVINAPPGLSEEYKRGRIKKQK